MFRNKPYFDTLIISDVHLGSHVSLAGPLLKLLKGTRFKRLILLGDMFADLNFARLHRDHWELLSHIRLLSNPKKGIEVVWVVGNHDWGLTEVMGHLVGVEVRNKYVWEAGSKRCVALHGHQFDPAMLGMPTFTKIVSWWFLQIQKIPGFQRAWSRWIDLATGKFQNLSKIVQTKALSWAKINQYDVICCGHTHDACHASANGVDYYNSGCWVKNIGTYIGVLGDQFTILQDNNDKT